MNPDIRSKIVKMMSASKDLPPPSFTRPSYSPTNCVNLHEISLHDVMMSLQDTESVVEKVNIEIDTQELPSSETANDQILIQAAKASKSPEPSSPKITPGDIRHLMSQAKRVANMHKIVYKVCSYDTSYSASLVDREANKGIAGDN